MKNIKPLLVLNIIVLFLSCIKNKEKTVDKVDSKEVKEVVSVNEVKSSSLLDKGIDVQKIKSQLDAVNTTFLSKEEVVFFEDKKKNNFYGDYTLIKNDKGGTPTRIVGNMVIYDSINPYRYEKNTDKFVEITLEDKGITLYEENLEVGVTTYSSILKNFGDDYQVINGVLAYTKGNKKAFFQVKDSIVTKLKIGIYKEDISANEILEKAKW